MEHRNGRRAPRARIRMDRWSRVARVPVANRRAVRGRWRLAGVPLLLTLRAKKVAHLYVSAWYLGAAFCWFPILFFVANFPGVHFGVEHATINWWFAHNVLGLWLTPMGLAIAYYFIPKVLGRSIPYGLSLIGFWSLALFYSQVGAHHFIGGPVPTWLIAVSIVHSVMMAIPVIAVAINDHVTMRGRFGALKHSPTLRFVVVGALMYIGDVARGVPGVDSCTESHYPLHPVHGRSRAHGALRLRFDGNLRCRLLHAPTPRRARVAVSESDSSPLLARDCGISSTSALSRSARSPAGARDARQGEAVPRLRSRDNPLSARSHLRRRAHDARTLRLRVPHVGNGDRTWARPRVRRQVGCARGGACA